MDNKIPNPKNNDILVYINGSLLKRDEAKISVFDSAVQGGDAVWEGIRVYDGKIFQLEAHLDRLIQSAKAMAFTEIPEVSRIKEAIFQTLQANGMKDHAHMRLTLTRGLKVTSGMNPKWNQYGCTLIVLAEWKDVIYDPSEGLDMITSSIRRNSPQCVDSKIHHSNLINNILAKIEANLANVDGSVMLDLNGFVSETNSTNIFFGKNGKLITPYADFCLPGITRQLIMDLAVKHHIAVVEKNITIAEMYTMDEMFVTGTEGGITPVFTVDGRTIGHGTRGQLTETLQQLHTQETENTGESLPF